MICLRSSPRTLARSARCHGLLLVVASILLPGCPGDPAADDEHGSEHGSDEGFDEPQVCIDPGSPLLEGAKTPKVPGLDAQGFSCSGGWGTDAPQLDASWTVELSAALDEFSFAGIVVRAHPDGGAVVAGTQVFARYDDGGEPLWADSQAIGSAEQMALVVEETGTIVLAIYDWNTDDLSVIRYAADGEEIGPVPIPWNSELPDVWGLATFGEDLVIGATDTDSEGSWETTLMRLDADDNLLLRKSSNMVGRGQLAVNESGTVAFGGFPMFLLSLEDGAVLGNLTPSTGNASQVAGLGEDFVMTGGAAGDLFVGRYSSFGAERWLQTYDRATLSDAGRVIAVGTDQTLVAAGNTTALDLSEGIWWFAGQPVVIAVDADGNALWSDRMAALGDATGVAIGSEGEVYVAGLAEGLAEVEGEQPPLIAWLRGYDP